MEHDRVSHNVVQTCESEEKGEAQLDRSKKHCFFFPPQSLLASGRLLRAEQRRRSAGTDSLEEV